MPSNLPTPLPLERLFAQLQTAGFRLDTRRKLRLWRALYTQGSAYIGRIGELKYLLAPLVATNGAEQERFYKLWEGFLEECDQEAERLNQEEAHSEPKSSSSFWWYVLWIVVAALLMAVLISQCRNIFKVEPLPVSFGKPISNLHEGETQHFENTTSEAGLTQFHWEVRDSASGIVQYTSDSKHLDWLAQGYGTDKWIILRAEGRRADSMLVHIHCRNAPRIDTIIWPDPPLVQNKKYVFEAKTEPGAKVYWISDVFAELTGSKTDTLTGNRVEYIFKDNGQFTFQCIITRPGHEADCYELETKTLSVGSDKPFLQLAELTYDQPRILRQLAPWLWALLLLPLLAAAWLFRRWWKKRHAQPTAKTAGQLADDYPIHDSAPYFIPYRPQNHRIGALAAFFRMAEVLSRREEDERRSFDAPASVQATIESGGFPSWRERAQTSPPDYLFLVTRPTERDQQGRLFERLCSFLKSQDAPLAVFYHDGQYRRFWNPDHPEGVSLAHLAQHFPDHQLVLLGDGHGLINPYDTRQPALYPEAAQLLHWRKRLLLTPAPVAAWSYQEALLHHYFLLYPADTDGLLEGFEALETLDDFEPGPYTLWEAALGRQRSDQSDRYRNWQTAAEHRDFLQNDPDGFRWLCGLAVTTQPDYALTLAIGQAMGVEVTHDRLLRLFRIPWLSANEPDNTLRLELLAQLTADEERIARQAATAELEALREQVAGAFAETDWKVNLAIHQFALDPRDEAHKQAIRELRQLGLLSGGQLAELDWLVQKRADGTGLPVGVKKNLDAWLDAPAKKPFWTLEIWVAAAVMGLTGILYQAAWRYNDRQQEQPVNQAAPLQFWQAEKKVDDEALRLNNEAVGIGKRLALIKSFSEWKARQDSAFIADSLFRRSIEIRGEYALADSNKSALLFNIAAERLNFYLVDSCPVSELGKLGIENPKIPIEPRPGPVMFGFSGNKSVIALAYGHCYGLYDYYIFKATRDTNCLGAAKQVYSGLLAQTNNGYFDSLRTTMPVNLQTLLFPDKTGQESHSRYPYAVRLLLLNAQTKAPVPDTRITLRNLRQITCDRRGRAEYIFPGRPFAFVQIFVKAARYSDWEGGFKPRTDNGVDTIWMQPLPSSNSNIDTDDDGVPDNDDKCPDLKGIKEFGGCPDGVVGGTKISVYVCDRFDQLDSVINSSQHLTFICFWATWDNPGMQQMLFFKKFNDRYKNTTQKDFRVMLVSLDFKPQLEGKVLPFLERNLFEGNYYLLADLDANNWIPRVHADWDGALPATVIINNGKRQLNLENYSDYSSFEAYYKQFLFDIPLPTMIPIAGGTLTLGCTNEQAQDCQEDEKPPHDVTLSDFSMSSTEVTNEQYAAFLNDYGSIKVKSGDYQGEEMISEYQWGIKFPDQKGLGVYGPQRGYEKYPVVYVSWYGANEYCRWLSEKTGQAYRLPTEAEWEYAGSDNLDEVAWYRDNGGKTQPVGGKKANALGLHDMSGNVYEWCSDEYREDYYKTIAKGLKDPDGPKSENYHVNRGGSWIGNPEDCRSAARIGNDANFRLNYLGFRVARGY